MKKNKDNLIPRSVLFSDPDKTQVKVSPDGKYLTYLAPHKGVLNIFLAEINDIENAQPITHYHDQRINAYFWSFEQNQLLFMKDNHGDENHMLFTLNVLNKVVKQVSPSGNKAIVIKLSQEIPKQILIGINNRTAEYFDIYKLNLLDGSLIQIFENNNFTGFLADDNLELRFCFKSNAEGGQEVYRLDKQLKPKLFDTVPYEDQYTTAMMGFDKSGKNIYMIDSRGKDKSALYQMHIPTKKKTLIFRSNKADLADVIFHPTKKTVQAAAFEYKRKEWKILDEAIEKDFGFLKSTLGCTFELISRNLKYDLWIVAATSDDKPVSYYKYDRKKGKLDFLFYNKNDLQKYQLAKMHPVIIKSRDGLNLVSYLTLPIEATKTKKSMRPIKPVPLILKVHGGPNTRDSWGYNSEHQWLANRGYAVLSVNYRASTGFGKKFITLGDGEWGAKMHDDLIDAAKWAIDNGITTKENVAIMGGSYGGYATLVGLTFTPDVFKCGVDIVGPSNLETLINSIPPYWKPLRVNLTKKIGGDTASAKDKKFLASRSPLTLVNKIKKPLLIAQGANDPRVKQAESDQIVAAMNKKNIPVTYVLFTDEGHGFSKPNNRLIFYSLTEKFLANCLGGRNEPYDEDFTKHKNLKITGYKYIE